MNKIHKAAALLTVVGAIGLTYAVLLIKGMPDTLTWEDEDEEIF